MNNNNSERDTSINGEIPTAQEHEIRVQKINQMRQHGLEPWPAAKEVTNNSQEVLSEYKSDEEEKKYIVSGRVMSLRGHGKTAFVTIQDPAGKLQLYFRQDILGDEKFKQFTDYVDIGDILWIKGMSFKTKAGEITLKVQDFSLISKCLYPLPDKFHGLEDVETRYRQRYLDLISNEESREKFKKRSAIVSSVRHYLENQDFMEVETPMLHSIPGGAAAKPFVTHHNALNNDFYLRIAPELFLKRLVVGGFERVFEINRNFRNEGISTRHNPEFTMLEFYIANKDYHFAMNLVEDLIRSVAKQVDGKLQLPYGNHVLDFEKPFTRISIKNAVLKFGNLTEQDLYDDKIDQVLENKKVKFDKKNGSINEKIYALFEHLVEAHLIQPTFVTDFPIEISPLAKRDPDNSDIAARFELYVGGIEISNGFNELNDPFDQAQRFKDQVDARESGDEEAHQYDAEYVHALEYALPPTAGVGIGIDRLTMLLTNTTSIKDVILFPTLKKK